MSKNLVEIQGQVMSGMGEPAGEAKGVMDGFIALHQPASADGEMPKRYDGGVRVVRPIW